LAIKSEGFTKISNVHNMGPVDYGAENFEMTFPIMKRISIEMALMGLAAFSVELRTDQLISIVRRH